jgi:hypothetical protein
MRVGQFLGALAAVAVLCVPAMASAATTPDAESEAPVTASLGMTPLQLDAALVGDDAARSGAGVAHHTRQYTYRRRYYRTRYYRPRHRHTVVVVDDPGPTVVTDPPLVKRRQGIRGLSLTLRTVGVTYGDTQLNSRNVKGNDIAGIGLGLRVPLDRHWSLEFAADLLGGTVEEDNSEVAVLPMTASLMAHLFPSSRLDIYGLGGLGIHRTAIQRDAGLDESYTQLGAHLGVGAELKLGHLLLTGDVRYLFLQNRPDPVAIQSSEQGLTPAESDPAPQVVRESVEDDLNTAVQGMLAIGYRW